MASKKILHIFFIALSVIAVLFTFANAALQPTPAYAAPGDIEEKVTGAVADGITDKLCGDLGLGGCLMKGMLHIYVFMIQLGLFLVGIAGLFLDVSLLLSFNMGALINPGTSVGAAVAQGWTIFRDLANLLFIGGFVWVSIAMILQVGMPGGGSTGKFIGNMIIAALLVNFSYFFAGAIIDASNNLSRLTYEEGVLSGQQSVTLGENISLPDLVKRVIDWSGTGGFASDASTTIADSPYGGFIGSLFLHETKIITVIDPEALKQEASTDPGPTLFLIMSMGLYFLIATIELFFSMAFVIIGRFLLIIILLVTSPLIVFRLMNIAPFAAWGDHWWKSLMSQVVFLPVFIFLVAVAFKISGGFFATLGASDLTLGSLVKNPNSTDFINGFSLAILFIISYGLLKMAKSVSQNLAQGKTVDLPSVEMIQGGAGKIGNAIGGFAGRLPRLPYRAAGRGVTEGVGLAGSGLSGLRKLVLPYQVTDVTSDIAGVFQPGKDKFARRAPRITRGALLKALDDGDYDRARGIWKDMNADDRADAYDKANGQQRKGLNTQVIPGGGGTGGSSTTQQNNQSQQPNNQGNVPQQQPTSTNSAASANLAAATQKISEALRNGNTEMLRNIIQEQSLNDVRWLKRDMLAEKTNAQKIVDALGTNDFNKALRNMDPKDLDIESARNAALHLDTETLSVLAPKTAPEVREVLINEAPEEIRNKYQTGTTSFLS